MFAPSPAMDDNLDLPCEHQDVERLRESASSSLRPRPRFFQPTDWASFCLTTALALGVYLFTLAPEVTLGFQGLFTTGAFYAGVSHPPGYPLWTLYAWLFTELLPAGNLAWRTAVSSAVAGALASGVLALMVSRTGLTLLDGPRRVERLPQKQENWLRIVSGYVAGMAFGFSGSFWGKAVIADVWPLSMLLLSLVLCLLIRWFHAPDQSRYLIAACFVYGLALTNSQALALAAPGLAVMAVLGNPVLGRDGLMAITLVIAVSVAAHLLGVFPGILAGIAQTDLFGGVYIWGGMVTFVISVGLAIQTKRIFTEWKTVLVSGCALVLGLSLYFYLPLASMTNPPVNWGYTRTVTGFVHLLRRGQYERIRPTDSPARFAEEMGSYVKTTFTDYGSIFLVPALVPFWFFPRMRSRNRRWICGTLAIYVCLSLLFVFFLNPSPDRQSLEINGAYFSASYLVMALWTGYGLLLVGNILGQPPAFNMAQK